MVPHRYSVYPSRKILNTQRAARWRQAPRRLRIVGLCALALAASMSGCGSGGSGSPPPSPTHTMETPLGAERTPTASSAHGAALQIGLRNGAGVQLVATLSGSRLSGPPADG